MTAISYLTAVATLATLFFCGAYAHGDHGHAANSGQQPMGEKSGDWATRHLLEEHLINNFDAQTFFTLHDFDHTGKWSPSDIKRLYGMYDESAASIPDGKKEDIVRTVLEMFDHDHSGYVTLDEWLEATEKMGKTLPDFGTGPGHHGDDEWEYEIHHFEKFHSGDDVTEEDLNHPEDIEHFRKHEEREAELEAWQFRERLGIVLENIPSKFRRSK